jgi:hypothetical protein
VRRWRKPWPGTAAGLTEIGYSVTPLGGRVP